MWPHVKWRRINTNHVSHYINSVTVMMDRASKVISTRNHKCVGRWPGVAVTIILSDLLWSRQPRAGDVLNRSYVYICLANSQQDLFYMPFQPKSRDNDASEPLLGACALPCRGCVTPLAPLWASPTSAASSLRRGGGTATQHVSFGRATDLDGGITPFSVALAVPFLINLRASLLALVLLSVEQAFSWHFPHYTDLFHSHTVIVCV